MTEFKRELTEMNRIYRRMSRWLDVYLAGLIVLCAMFWGTVLVIVYQMLRHFLAGL